VLEELVCASGFRLVLEDVNDQLGRVPNLDSLFVACLDENHAIESIQDLDRRVLGDAIGRVADQEDEPLSVEKGSHAL